jgi:hypothetical protein
MWTLDLDSLIWARKDPTLTLANVAGSAPISLTPGGTPTDINYSVYDTSSQLVYTYIANADILASYDPVQNTLTSLVSGKLAGQIGGVNIRANAVIDPVRNIFLIVGQGTIAWFDLNTMPPNLVSYSVQAAAGCKPSPDPNNPAIEDAISPGLVYDRIQDRVVGWAGGNTVWLIDTTATTAATPSLSCTALTTFRGGPPPTPLPTGGGTSGEQKNGTFGRFRYFPSLICS